VLLLINGAPGVGKTTLAQRYAQEHPLALLIEIDAIRTQLGQWAELEASRLVARDLAEALARAHLRNGYDVVVPQYLGRPEFRARLQRLAGEVGAAFVEVLLTDDTDRITRRFRQRRAELAAGKGVHPERDLADDAVATEVARANEALGVDAARRGIAVVSAVDGPDASYLAMQAAIGAAG
jgi:predicted kinase